MRRTKSLRIGVHHANAVVWEPVYRTHLFSERGEDGVVAARRERGGVASGEGQRKKRGDRGDRGGEGAATRREEGGAVGGRRVGGRVVAEAATRWDRHRRCRHPATTTTTAIVARDDGRRATDDARRRRRDDARHDAGGWGGAGGRRARRRAREMSRTRRGARDGGVPTWGSLDISCRENSATIAPPPPPRRVPPSQATDAERRRPTRGRRRRRRLRDQGIRRDDVATPRARAPGHRARRVGVAVVARSRSDDDDDDDDANDASSPSRDPRHGVLARGARGRRARRDDREGRAARRAAARDHDADRARDPRRAEGPLGVPRRAVASDPQFLNHRARRPRQGAFFFTLVPIRPRSRGERRSLRNFAVVSLRPPLAFNPRPRRLSTPTDAFEHHPAIALYGTTTASRRSRTDSSR